MSLFMTLCSGQRKETGQEMVARWVSEREEIELIDIVVKQKEGE